MSTQTLEAGVNALVQTPLTPDQLLIAQAAATEQLEHPETQSQLLAATKELARAGGEIDSSFLEIEITLKSVDSKLEDVKTVSGQPFQKYAPRWAELRQEWIDLFWEARGSASNLQVFVQGFQFILNNVHKMQGEKDAEKQEETFKEITKELKEFLEENHPEHGGSAAEKVLKAQEHAKGFEKLANKVIFFKNEITGAIAKELGAENAVLLGLKQEVEGLDKKIDECSGFLYKVGKFLGLLPDAHTVDAVDKVGKGLSMLFVFSPLCVFGVVCQGMKAVVAAKDDFVSKNVTNVDDMIAQKKQKMEQMKQIGRQVEVLEQVKHQLENHENQFEGICQRLKQFGKFWSLVWAEANGILIALQNASVSKYPGTLKRNVEMSNASMKLLADALKEYVSQVDSAKLS